MAKEELESGVIFAREDCLGVGRRLLIDVVDVLVAVVASIVLTGFLGLVPGFERILQGGGLLIWLAVWIGYFVILKGSRYRTLGYVVAGARIVNLSGMPPSFAQLLLRFAFSVFGPLNLLLDILWIPSDPSRQALRDKFAATYVVRKSAVPRASGRVVFTPYTMFGQSYIFREVREAANSPVAS